MKNVSQESERGLITSNDMAQDGKAMRRGPLSLWDFFSRCSAVQWRRIRELPQAPNPAHNRPSINICWRNK